MQVLKVIYIVCAVIAGLAIIVAAVKSHRARHYLLISALVGIAGLIIASITGSFTGFGLPINLWTLICSAALSLPGVILMIILKLVWIF